MMTSTGSRWFSRHPVLTLLGMNLVLVLVIALIAEAVLRISIPYNPGYYIAVQGSSTELVYPYGTIYMNSYGFSDKEFDLENPNRIGYFGDSVTYGTGAGYGYRVTELLEAVYPEYEHMNFGGIDLSASNETIDYFTRVAREFELDRAIYLFNMNDILTNRQVAGEEKAPVTVALGWIKEYADVLRGKSYAYTYVRNLVKSALATGGTGWRGYKAYEFHPDEYADVMAETAERINELGRRMDALGIEFTVVLLPYEMQISNEAAETYAGLGVEWEDGFLDGATQDVVARHLEGDFRVLDAYDALVDPAQPEVSKRENRLGEYFVYDKGDKLDWNHPNRAGHRKIADYLIQNEVFGPTGMSAQAAAVHEGR